MFNTKIIIAGTTVTMQSAHTLEDLEKVANYKPDAMRLTNEAGETQFCVLPGIFGSVEPNGIVYSDTAPDGSGEAVVSIPLPTMVDKSAKEAVAEVYGPIIANANKVEAQIEEALAEVNTMLADIKAQIVVAAQPAPVDTGAACRFESV